MSDFWVHSLSRCCSRATAASSTGTYGFAVPKSAWFGLSSFSVLPEGSCDSSDLEDGTASGTVTDNSPSA